MSISQNILYFVKLRIHFLYCILVKDQKSPSQPIMHICTENVTKSSGWNLLSCLEVIKLNEKFGRVHIFDAKSRESFKSKLSCETANI